MLSRSAEPAGLFSPSPGTPGEGWGEGSPHDSADLSPSVCAANPHPALLRSTGRGKDGRFHLLLAILVIPFLPLISLGADAPSERLPVPNSAAQGKIQAALRSQYKQEFAKRTAEDRLALAEDFHKQALEEGTDPVRQYVLLRAARELATDAGNFDVGFAIIDDTARRFTVDASELKVTALTDAMDRTSIPKAELFENYHKVGEAALTHGDIQLAYQVTVLERILVRGAKDAVLTQRARQFDLRVHDARREYAAIVAAARKLQANPDDAEASLQVGRYFCFRQRRWEEGLPLLAQGADPKLRDLAKRDLDAPEDANAMAELADAWWNLPDSKQAPQRAARERAAHWYAEALPKLEGEKQARAQQRIEEGQRMTESR
jgi:hypothetical protein